MIMEQEKEWDSFVRKTIKEYFDAAECEDDKLTLEKYNIGDALGSAYEMGFTHAYEYCTGKRYNERHKDGR